jgi:hypothetical protein
MLAIALTFVVAAAPQSRPVEAFTSINSGGSFTVEVKGGDAPAVAVDAEDPAEGALIDTKVEKGALSIGCNKNPCNFKKKVTILVTATSLDSYAHGGSGSVTIADVKSKKLTLNVGGSGTLDWKGSAEELLTNLGGSGKITLAGKSARVELSIGGSGEVDASALEVKDAKVAIGGSGRATVNALAELDAVVSGSGRVSYLGNPRVKKTVSGSGTVEKKEAPKKASSGW